MTLSDFITDETRRLMKFANTWRKLAKENPEKYKEELASEFAWFRQYMAFCSYEGERNADKDETKTAA